MGHAGICLFPSPSFSLSLEHNQLIKGIFRSNGFCINFLVIAIISLSPLKHASTPKKALGWNKVAVAFTCCSKALNVFAIALNKLRNFIVFKLSTNFQEVCFVDFYLIEIAAIQQNQFKLIFAAKANDSNIPRSVALFWLATEALGATKKHF